MNELSSMHGFGWLLALCMARVTSPILTHRWLAWAARSSPLARRV